MTTPASQSFSLSKIPIKRCQSDPLRVCDQWNKLPWDYWCNLVSDTHAWSLLTSERVIREQGHKAQTLWFWQAWGKDWCNFHFCGTKVMLVSGTLTILIQKAIQTNSCQLRRHLPQGHGNKILVASLKGGPNELYLEQKIWLKLPFHLKIPSPPLFSYIYIFSFFSLSTSLSPISASLSCVFSFLTLPKPLRPVLLVPGYTQVSGWRKDLFCCLGSLVSQWSPRGASLGGSTSLCLPLAPLCYAALHRYFFRTVWYGIWCSLSIGNPFPCT